MQRRSSTDWGRQYVPMNDQPNLTTPPPEPPSTSVESAYMVWRSYPPPPVIYLPAPGQPMPSDLPPLPAPWGAAAAATSPTAAPASSTVPHTRQLPTLEEALKRGKLPDTDELKQMPSPAAPSVSAEPPAPAPPAQAAAPAPAATPAAAPSPEKAPEKVPDTHQLPLLEQAVKRGAPIRTDELEKLKGPAPSPPGKAPDTHRIPPLESIVPPQSTPSAPASVEDTTVESKRSTVEVEAVPADADPEKPGDLFRTFIVQRNYALRRMLAVDNPTNPPSRVPPTKVTLLFRGVPERFLIAEDQVVILGRSDFRSGGLQVDIDLSRYGGHERGVSRAHARLHVRDKRIYLTDLYSANGTYLNGQRLEPEQPYLLQNGAEFLLGALSAKIEWE